MRQSYKLYVIMILACCLGGMRAAAQIDGKWKDDKSGGIVNVYHTGDKYFGVAVSGGNAKDQAALQGKQVMILKDFSKKGDRTWDGGTVFEPWLKITADGVLVLVNDSTLKVTGTYMMISQTHVWTRVRS